MHEIPMREFERRLDGLHRVMRERGIRCRVSREPD